MYEENALGKKPEVQASFYGNLTMERVIKDETDQQKTGSLVFRIKRVLPETNDDSGIRCSSPSSDEMSTKEQMENSRASPIRVQIPLTLLARSKNGIKVDRSESNSSEDLAIPKEISDSSDLNENITVKLLKTEFANADTKNDNSNSKKALENVETELVPTDVKNNDLNDDGIVKNIETELVNVKTRKRTKRVFPRFKVPIELRRRSSRIVHLRLQKESQQDLSVDIASNGESKCDIKEEDGAGTDCDSNQVGPSIVMKKRQKRKIVPKAVKEFTKRKYARPGRPPKLALESVLDTEKQSLPFISGVNNISTENGRLHPITNNIWTLVPKSLFESDFFKSQVLEVRPAQPLDPCRFPAPRHYFSPTITPSVPCISHTRVQLKQPKNVVNRVSEVPRKMLEDANSKRPTVIYFNKNCNALLTNQATMNKRQPEFSNKTESTKIHDDLLYLNNKYRMLDEAVVKHCYELNKRDINETDSKLSNLFSSSLNVTSDEVIENVYIKHGASTNYISDAGSTDAVSNHSATDDTSPRAMPSSEDTDTLCRSVIVKSLQILFDEESVLQ